MKYKDYMLVKDTDRYQLEKKVRILLEQGYVPLGAAFSAVETHYINKTGNGRFYESTWLYQTMVLEKE